MGVKPQKGKSIKAKNSKANPYRLTPGETPYPNHLVELLSHADGHITPLVIFPTPPAMVPGSEEVLPVLDALIRTRLSANTSRTNYLRAFQGLTDSFGVLEDGIGKGGVNWNNVRNANIQEVFDAIKSGGLAATKSKDIKEILEIVYQENLARRNAHKRAAELKDQSLTSASTQSKTLEQNADKIVSAGNRVLSLEYLHELSSEDALNELTRFPGIGLNSASIVLLFCLKRPTFPVDTHAFRLCRWLNWVPENASPKTTYMHCEVRVPSELKRPLVEVLVKHGMNCPRCKSTTGEGSKGWEKDCPIEHLVKRTGQSMGADTKNRGKEKNKAERGKEKKRTRLEADD
jgi:endonuclease III